MLELSLQREGYLEDAAGAPKTRLNFELPHDKYHVEIPKYHEIFHLLAYVISGTYST